MFNQALNHLKIKSLKLEVRLQLNIEHTRVDLFAYGHKVGLITHWHCTKSSASENKNGKLF